MHQNTTIEPISTSIEVLKPTLQQFSMPVLPSFEQLKSKLITKNNEQENTNAEVHFTQNDLQYTETQLVESNIKILLQEYAQQRKSADKMLEFMVFQDRPFEINQQILILKFENEIEQNQFNGLKNEFYQYLKTKLGFLPIIETKVEQMIEKKQLYSSTDKYNHFIEKFPLIEELKRRLGLELDM